MRMRITLFRRSDTVRSRYSFTDRSRSGIMCSRSPLSSFADLVHHGPADDQFANEVHEPVDAGSFDAQQSRSAFAG